MMEFSQRWQPVQSPWILLTYHSQLITGTYQKSDSDIDTKQNTSITLNLNVHLTVSYICTGDELTNTPGNHIYWGNQTIRRKTDSRSANSRTGQLTEMFDEKFGSI